MTWVIAHRVVVDDDGEHEERVAVGLDDDEVLDAVVGELDVAAHDVVHRRHALVGDAEAQRPPGPGPSPRSRQNPS